MTRVIMMDTRASVKWEDRFQMRCHSCHTIGVPASCRQMTVTADSVTVICITEVLSRRRKLHVAQDVVFFLALMPELAGV